MPSPAAVTGNFQDATGADPQAAFIRFRLRNYSGFVARILSTTTVIEPQIDVTVDPTTGNISTNIWGNDNIDPANTFWTVEYWSNGRIVFSGNYLITGSAFNLNSAPIINPPALGSAQTLQGLPQFTLLETEGVQNAVQSTLDLHGTGGISLSNSTGRTTIDGSSISGYFAGSNIVSNAGPVNTQLTTGCLYSEALNTPHTFIGVTATELPYFQISSGSTASNSSSVWGTDNQNGNINLGYGFPIALLRTYSIYGKLNRTTNIRCWLGAGGQTTVNGGQNAFATDALAAGTRFIGFRFSAGVDTHWQGVVSSGGGSQTLVDTGITPDTNPHTFKVTYDGATASFFIDGAFVGSLAIAMSSSAMVYNSVDNKNTANDASFFWNNFYFLLKR